MDRLPLNVRALVAVGLAALLGVGGSLGLLVPKLRQIQILKAQLAREQQALGSPQPVPSALITEGERKLWGELEDRLRGRYPGELALPRAAGAVASLARASGMEIVRLQVQTPQPGSATDRGKAPPPPPFQPPPELAVNLSTIKLLARHRYRDLVEFLEGLGPLPVYLAIQSVEVKRVENRLTTEVSFASFRWGK